MRKVWPYILGVGLAAAAAAVIGLAVYNAKNSSQNNNQNTSQNGVVTAYNSKQACGIFTLADAKVVLGDSAKGGTNPKNTSSSDLQVSTCTYTQDTGSNAPTTPADSASLLVRAPKTAAAAASNRNEFGKFRPAGVQDVDGYGSNAFWDVQNGQLNILKNDTWYVLTNGSPEPADRTLDQAKQLADLLINKM